MAIEIRVLHAGDEHVLAAVAEDVFDETVRAELAREFLVEPRFHIVVAVDGGIVIGIATGLVHMHPDKGPEFFVNEVGVAPSHQRRGIATRLMRAILAEARTAGASEAWLGTETVNEPALALYRSLLTERDREEPMVVFTYALTSDEVA